jgi:hypothetical protein
VVVVAKLELPAGLEPPSDFPPFWLKPEGWRIVRRGPGANNVALVAAMHGYHNITGHLVLIMDFVTDMVVVADMVINAVGGCARPSHHRRNRSQYSALARSRQSPTHGHQLH